MVVSRVWVLAALVVALVAAGAAAAARLAWPEGEVAGSPSGLAEISLPGFAGRVASVEVEHPSGESLPVTFREGTIVPRERIAPGERLTVTARIRRPGWIGWLVGRSVERRLTVVAPVAHLSRRFLRPARGAAVSVRFASPVARVAIGGRASRIVGGRTFVPLGIRAAGATSAGSTTIAAAARPWETLSAPERVSWFVADSRTTVVSLPVAGHRLLPQSTLTLTFARPVAAVLGSHLPQLQPAKQGRWVRADPHTLAFQPAGFGFGLGGTVRVRLPGQVLTWRLAEVRRYGCSRSSRASATSRCAGVLPRLSRRGRRPR